AGELVKVPVVLDPGARARLAGARVGEGADEPSHRDHRQDRRAREPSGDARLRQGGQRTQQGQAVHELRLYQTAFIGSGPTAVVGCGGCTERGGTPQPRPRSNAPARPPRPPTAPPPPPRAEAPRT